MTNENPTPQEEAEATPPEESKSEESSEFFEESKDDSKSLEERLDRMEKGLNKFFSQKGRQKETPKEQPKEAEKTPIQTSDDVTELFLESKPEAELVKDDLKKVADKLYDGSIIKAWKNETWLHDKAAKLAEENKAKSKISTPSNQIEGEIDFARISKMTDEEQGNAIVKMSDKEYKKWQDYQRKSATTPGKITL